MSEEFQPQPENTGSSFPMDEKVEEKGHEKVDEKQVHEKGHRDALGNVIWAGILIWAGVALLATNLGTLDALPLLSGLQGWALVFTGAVVILILEVFARLLIPAYRQPVIGTMLVGLVFMSIGLGDSFGWDYVWPVILIAVGVSIIVGGFTRRS